MRTWFLALLLIAFDQTARADGIRMGLSFTQDQWVDCVERSALEIFDLYILIEGSPPIRGWEMGMSTQGNGAQLLILSATCHPSGAYCGEPYNWIVALGVCMDFGELGVLITFQCVWLSDQPFEDVIVCAGGTTPTSFGGAPGVADCGYQLHEATIANVGNQGAPAGCAVINPSEGCTPLPVRPLSVSLLKGRYD